MIDAYALAYNMQMVIGFTTSQNSEYMHSLYAASRLISKPTAIITVIISRHHFLNTARRDTLSRFSRPNEYFEQMIRMLHLLHSYFAYFSEFHADAGTPA
jgi:hypothetical protein